MAAQAPFMEGTEMESMDQDPTASILIKECLDDMELARIPLLSILLKCNRVARVAKDDKSAEWIWAELYGYSSPTTDSLREYMAWTCRTWQTPEGTRELRSPIDEIELSLDAYDQIAAATTEALTALSPPSPSISEQSAGEAASLATILRIPTEPPRAQLTIITTRVRKLLHRFVCTHYS